MTEPKSPKPESREPLGGVARLLDMLPDLIIGLMFGVLAFDYYGYPGFNNWLMERLPWWRAVGYQGLWIIAALEAAFLWPQMTLVDIATRVENRPPWWLIPPIVVGVLLLFGWGPLLKELLTPSSVMFVPVAFSIWQRAQMLWTLPGKSAIDKMRARAIMGGRFTIALVVVAVPLVHELARAMVDAWRGNFNGSTLLQDPGVIYVMGTLMFLLAAFDHWRVGGAAFARHPRPIFRWDFIGVRQLDGGF